MGSLTFTFADMEAYALICRARRESHAELPEEVLEAGNQIILLAEKIKAQRASMAMQRPTLGQVSRREERGL